MAAADPGGNPVIAVPGATPTLPPRTLSPALVTVVPPRTEKAPALPSWTGPAVTVKHPVHMPEPASGLVTVTLRVPVAAPRLTEMFTVTWVALSTVVEFTVMPEPENDVAAPARKPVPVTTMLWLAAPCARDGGLAEMTVGAVVTLKHPVQEANLPSGLVTVTSRPPMVAPDATEMFSVTWVALSKVVELTVMSVPENDPTAPGAKLVPVTATSRPDAPCGRDDGFVDRTVGTALTVKHPVQVPAVASGFVTVTSCRPVLAPEAIVTLAVTWVLLSNVVEFTVMPAPGNDATAPGAKLAPVTTMSWLPAP